MALTSVRPAYPPDVPVLTTKSASQFTPTSIATDDPTIETTQHRLGHRPLGCGLGNDPCAVFRPERRLWKRPAPGDICRTRLRRPHGAWSRGHQALPANVVAMAQGGERRLSHSQAGRRGHALDALRLDGADAVDRLDRRLKDGMLHGRSRAAEHRSSWLRPFHRRSD